MSTSFVRGWLKFLKVFGSSGVAASFVCDLSKVFEVARGSRDVSKLCMRSIEVS